MSYHLERYYRHRREVCNSFFRSSRSLTLPRSHDYTSRYLLKRVNFYPIQIQNRACPTAVYGVYPISPHITNRLSLQRRRLRVGYVWEMCGTKVRSYLRLGRKRTTGTATVVVTTLYGHHKQVASILPSLHQTCDYRDI